ncbi:hypothetical protein PUR34_09210 [Streptomyces sp. JV185]|nr:hypothetical protein [Streptomyces sp. JV185]MEE1768339.1 hypothetical protein [Streptomyces sp. JV185]
MTDRLERGGQEYTGYLADGREAAMRGCREARSIAQDAPSWMRRADLVAVEDVEHVEDVAGAADEAELVAGLLHGEPPVICQR